MANDKTLMPSDFVLPIVEINPNGTLGSFLGTSFFAGEKNTLVTCDHVLGSGKKFAVVSQEGMEQHSANVILRNASLDVALLDVPDYCPPHSLPLHQGDRIGFNCHVMSFEYGTTISAGHITTYSPANRIDNITRPRNLDDLFREAGEDMLELSYPALKGASGSPVMDLDAPYRLHGMITQNLVNESLPAQIEKTYGEAELIEGQTKFYLPQALAINVKHIRKLLEEAQL